MTARTLAASHAMPCGMLARNAARASARAACASHIHAPRARREGAGGTRANDAIRGAQSRDKQSRDKQSRDKQSRDKQSAAARAGGPKQ
ncbi:hypothetical protein [Burkholderia pseudomallei]|uniref:hypothetical protein n=1 Tax=Burkholderia pseudomallei TaxID=28450 RepID=UPI000F05244F|nr:hypothetical protein [Burkholderia pseudomallei]